MPLSSGPSSTDGNPPNHPPAQMLWQQMSGYRGLHLAAILAMFAQPVISFETPLLASATIDYALSFEPREVEVAEGQVTHLVQENLSGLRVGRAFARQEYEINKFAGPIKLYRDRSLKLLRLMANYWATSDLIVLSQQGLVLFVGIYFISTGSLTVGTLFAFMMFINMLLWPVRQMGRIGEIISEQHESMPTTPKQFPERCHGKIEVTDLHFAHSKDIAAIQGIEFTVEAGETLAIVGPSGSGKSTLMHLLLCLYDYEQGAIRLDGMELSELDRSWVRAQFSVVLQEPFLFSKTIGDNIRFGQLNAATDQIAEAARMAHIHDAILNFPQGYQTLVGERGVTLSRRATPTRRAGACGAA